MAAWVQAWAVAWVVCLAAQAHAQLGVRGVGGGTGGAVDTPTTTTTTTTTDQLMQGGDGEGKEGGHVVPGVREGSGKPWVWRPLAKTYQGCFTEDHFNGTLMFVNFTQVMAVQQAASAEEACFYLCRSKEPFATYIAVSPSVGGGEDGCGCKHYLNPEDEVDGADCDEVLGHYRAYCGPANWDCINRAGQINTPASILLLPLLTLLLSRLCHHGA
ncbi:uncharacterized protein LOC126983213 isoform X1 [Eriocheir sinensis]|uniref:uncharacterized protein LOC126983213 isoform X1 n=1 Tax=Eriocheir sinensis TaxID=95602 RepID=UPI0021CA2A37|nr:uncharacterized protein LOC126983213 isoform X1 [Eriocheir sinensis]